MLLADTNRPRGATLGRRGGKLHGDEDDAFAAQAKWVAYGKSLFDGARQVHGYSVR